MSETYSQTPTSPYRVSFASRRDFQPYSTLTMQRYQYLIPLLDKTIFQSSINILLLFCLLGCSRQETTKPATTIPASSPATTLASPITLKTILTPRTVEATIYELGADKKSVEVLERTTKALAEHKEWFIEYVKEHGGKSGPLPYHPNMGITPEEYKLIHNVKFLAQPARQVSLTFLYDDNKNIKMLASTGELQQLNDVTFTFPSEGIKTPFGNVESSTSTKTDDYLGLGPLQGFRWRTENAPNDSNALSNLSSFSASSIQITVGTLLNNGNGLLIYRARKVTNGSVEVNTAIIITFPLPPISR